MVRQPFPRYPQLVHCGVSATPATGYRIRTHRLGGTAAPVVAEPRHADAPHRPYGRHHRRRERRGKGRKPQRFRLSPPLGRRPRQRNPRVGPRRHQRDALDRSARTDRVPRSAHRIGQPQRACRWAEQAIARCVAEKKPSFVVLGVLDLDEFAAVNLHYGIVRKDTGSRSRCLRRKLRRGRRRARSFTKLSTSRNLHYR